MGERCDARRELGPWHPVAVRDRDDVRIVPERAQPIRATEDLQPVAIARRGPGAHVVDFGQNMVGWARLTVRGPSGTRVQLRFAEMLAPDGSVYMEISAAPASSTRTSSVAMAMRSSNRASRSTASATSRSPASMTSR